MPSSSLSPCCQHVISGYHFIISISQVGEKRCSDSHLPIVSWLSINMSMSQHENTESLKQMSIIYIHMNSFLLKENKANMLVTHFTETAAWNILDSVRMQMNQFQVSVCLRFWDMFTTNIDTGMQNCIFPRTSFLDHSIRYKCRETTCPGVLKNLGMLAS